MNQRCLWCGRFVVLIKSVNGVAVAVQCPLCLDTAPYGQPVGKARIEQRAKVTRGEAKERREVKAAKLARQQELFKK